MEEALRFWRRALEIYPGCITASTALAIQEMRLRLGSLETRVARIASQTPARTEASEVAPAPGFETREVFALLIGLIYKRWLGRKAAENEIDIWYTQHLQGLTIPNLLTAIDGSEEAARARGPGATDEYSDGKFVQLLYEIVLGRGASPSEIEHHQQALSLGQSRSDLLVGFFLQAAREAMTPRSVQNNPAEAHMFGRPNMLTLADWVARKADIARGDDMMPPVKTARFMFTSSSTPLVSVIASLYCGGRFVEAFLENMTSQTIFNPDCELIIIDANSPENEGDIIERYAKKFSNIRYRRYDRRVGIYEAWNIGVEMARGTYCTNANFDDCRRADCFERQAATLDAMPFVDVVYQNVFYSFEENLRFDDIARYGFSTDLPIVSRYNLLEFNCPHNAPMWRKQLHGEIGLFDADLHSAGDYDFWLRCLAAGKTFWKINEPLVAYYVNPQGLSTREDTQGVVEANRITKRMSRRIISENIVLSDDDFALKVEGLCGAALALAPDRYALVQSALRRVSATARSSKGLR